ncbi:hypothetical protein V6N12_073166 [Hibiscus sabdariffa]|uniref:Uncharacterized protein n=1 Tax=Hibiscus sabdariffa TaxID=183260 RepID=A0ABR2B6V3_9ROSI
MDVHGYQTSNQLHYVLSHVHWLIWKTRVTDFYLLYDGFWEILNRMTICLCQLKLNCILLLYRIASHTTDYQNPMLFFNTLAISVLVIVKFPNMHRVRIFGINADH